MAAPRYNATPAAPHASKADMCFALIELACFYMHIQLPREKDVATEEAA